MSVLEISPLDDANGVRLAGELDLGTVPRLTEALLDVPRDGEVTLDLAALTFVDSAGLHTMVALARSSASVVLLDPSAAILRSLEIAGIDRHPGIEIRHADPEPIGS